MVKQEWSNEFDEHPDTLKALVQHDTEIDFLKKRLDELEKRFKNHINENYAYEL